MNRTRAIKYKEVAAQLDKDHDVIALVSCNTCVRLAKTGGQAKMKKMATQLKGDEFQVKEGFLITLPCWDSCLENFKLNDQVNTVIIIGCSCAKAAIETLYPKMKVVSAIMDRGMLIEDPETHRKGFRGTKSC